MDKNIRLAGLLSPVSVPGVRLRIGRYALHSPVQRRPSWFIIQREGRGGFPRVQPRPRARFVDDYASSAEIISSRGVSYPVPSHPVLSRLVPRRVGELTCTIAWKCAWGDAMSTMWAREQPSPHFFPSLSPSFRLTSQSLWPRVFRRIPWGHSAENASPRNWLITAECEGNNRPVIDQFLHSASSANEALGVPAPSSTADRSRKLKLQRDELWYLPNWPWIPEIRHFAIFTLFLRNIPEILEISEQR